MEKSGIYTWITFMIIIIGMGVVCYKPYHDVEHHMDGDVKVDIYKYNWDNYDEVTFTFYQKNTYMIGVCYTAHDFTRSGIYTNVEITEIPTQHTFKSSDYVFKNGFVDRFRNPTPIVKILN